MTTFDVRVESGVTEIQYNDFHVIKDGAQEEGDTSFVNVAFKKDDSFMYRIAKEDIDNYIKALQKAKELWG